MTDIPEEEIKHLYDSIQSELGEKPLLTLCRGTDSKLYWIKMYKDGNWSIVGEAIRTEW